MIRRVIFVFLVLAFMVGGFWIGQSVVRQPFLSLGVQGELGLMLLAAVLGGLIGIVAVPRLMEWAVRVTTRLEHYLQRAPVQDLLFAALGLIIGLLVANLLGSVFAFLGLPGKLIWVGTTLLLGYLGLSLGLKKKEELLAVFSSLPRIKERGVKGEGRSQYKILDTSVIIDGRIADLCASGFIEGTLLVPSFVLEELRHIADSPDLLRRNRGRRGLEILNKMRKDPEVRIQVYDQVRGLEDAAEVDTKLVRLAQRLQAKIVTNDYNLNKVAELHGVKVLNVNELANAVKPVVLPGEEMVVQVVKDGKEIGQGVAYLDDGTMVVIDGGKKHIGQTINVLVTSVLQTAAGRMIFARPKPPERRGEHGALNGVNVLG
ncbi:MAG: PIN/TRAM domain-containing protein [Desulfotomaculales bacterium]